MNGKYVLELIDDLGGLEVIENLLYKEIRLIEEMGNPTTEHYKGLKELYKLISEL